jgi:bifunctional non-homologous end joining protein LigD
MGLSKYRDKRNFITTPEPEPKLSRKRPVLTFVVQRHDATRLHYDFRIELEGVLKSWAVPKGPSMVAGEKRLAVMVEDHPLDYGNFHGEIPEGNYGAGKVDIWDKGTYSPYKLPEGSDQENHLLNQLHKGDIKIQLKGKHLKGAFALVRLKGDEEKNWLLIKKKDGYDLPQFDIESIKPLKKAKKSRRNRKDQLEKKVDDIHKIWTELNKPMLATLGSTIPNNTEWIYEVKYDGYRAMALINENKVDLFSKNGNNLNQRFKSLIEELQTVEDQVILDGEIVLEDEKGISDFHKLQAFADNVSTERLIYYVFDILYLNDHKTINLPLVSRKELLLSFFNKYQFKKVTNSSFQLGDGKDLYKKLIKLGHEGIVAKAKDSIYLPGKRSKSWLKIKSTRTIEAIICGFTKPHNSRKHFGALILGIYEDSTLNYIGSCGSGFTDKMLKDLFDQLSSLRINENPFKKSPSNFEGNVVWVKPQVVCCVRFLSWTNNNLLRNPIFLGLKDGEKLNEINQKNTAVMKDANTENQSILEFGRKKLKVTNLGKVYWPHEGITKGDLISYYDQISNYILPYLKNRPQSLNRFPNGIKGPSFYQKDMEVSQMPKWAKTVKMYSKSNDNEIDYLVCNDKATLLYMVNLGCIEINPWHSIYTRPDNPDYMMLDLDPGNIPFKEVVNTALVIKDLCDSLNINSFCKTSGATGLHIFIPLGAKYDYEQVKSFAEILASLTQKRLPAITSIERMTSKRKDKVYVDFLQNRKGQTIAAPYSVRPRPGATVSAPLQWEEVNHHLDPSMFNIYNMEKRLSEVGDLWQGVLSKPIDIMRSLKKIEKLNS